MSQPAIAAAPVPFLCRAFNIWLGQVKHALPPTIFFFLASTDYGSKRMRAPGDFFAGSAACRYQARDAFPPYEIESLIQHLSKSPVM